ncbi:MAG: glutamate formimidoyltransferase [Thermoplasmata archaeon]|nr:glutamate formimidoyltransferase [Thermoplasmata archaeon]
MPALERIVECVPNFSEGRNSSVIEEIVEAARSVEGVKVITYEMDKDYNRTVVTLVGGPENIVDGALAAARKALELIDMRGHKGEHPRMGAVDVVPFVPIRGVTMEECVSLAKKFGEALGELGVPVYLYEYAATRPERKNLANVRRGEYEGLPEKLRQEEWTPDYGPGEFNPKSGATAVGARKILVAYNVNLTTNDVSKAKHIAEEIRESGRIVRDAQGNKVLDENGKVKRIPGRLKAVKAIGVLLEEHDIAQVSMNLVDYETTPPHVAYEACAEEARKMGIDVDGSEIVGVVPEEALVLAGKRALEKRGEVADGEEWSTPEERRRLVEEGSRYLGLSRLAPFEPDEKVIEYIIERI